jgi:hypothetical protein
MDDLIKLATGGVSSTSAMGEGVTEGENPSCETLTVSAIHSRKKGEIIDRTFETA